MAKSGKTARSLFIFSVAFFLFLDLLFEVYLRANFELTFSKFVLTLFTRFAGELTGLIIAGLSLYVVYGIALGLLGLGIARYLAEEIGIGISALVAGYILYDAIISSYTPELFNYLLGLIAIYAIFFGIAAAFRKYRALLRILGFLVMFVYVAYYYAFYHAGVDIGFGFLFLAFITASVPLIKTVGTTTEISLRRRLKRPIFVAYSIVFLVVGLAFLVASFFILLDTFVVALIYGYSGFLNLGILLFFISLFLSTTSLAAGDTLVVAAVVNPENLGDAAALALFYGFYFGRRRLILLLKVLVVAVLLALYLLREDEEKDKKRKKAELTNITLGALSPADFFYLFYPYLAAVMLYTRDELRRYAALEVLLENAFLLFLFGVYSAVYTMLLAATASAIGAIFVAAILYYVYLVPFTVTTIAVITLALFPVVYAIMGPTAAAARGYFVIQLLRENEEEIKRIIERYKTEAPKTKPPSAEEAIAAYGRLTSGSLDEAIGFLQSVLEQTSKRIKEEYEETDEFKALAKTLEDKAKGLELKRRKRFFRMPVLIFDADGTLYVHSNQKAAYLKALGVDYSEEREKYKRVAMEIGDPSFLNQRVFFALIEKSDPHEAIRKAYERRKVFREEILKEIEPSDIAKILPELFNRYPIIVASNDTKDFLLDKLAKVGALPYVHHVYTASDFGILKPHDAFFNRLREEIEEHYGHTRLIFVDDLDVNVEAAKRNGFEAYKPEEFVRLYREGKLI